MKLLLIGWWFLGAWGSFPFVLGPYDSQTECRERQVKLVQDGKGYSSVLLDCWYGEGKR